MPVAYCIACARSCLLACSVHSLFSWRRIDFGLSTLADIVAFEDGMQGFVCLGHRCLLRVVPRCRVDAVASIFIPVILSPSRTFTRTDLLPPTDLPLASGRAVLVHYSFACTPSRTDMFCFLFWPLVFWLVFVCFLFESIFLFFFCTSKYMALATREGTRYPVGGRHLFQQYA